MSRNVISQQSFKTLQNQNYGRNLLTNNITYNPEKSGSCMAWMYTDEQMSKITGGLKLDSLKGLHLKGQSKLKSEIASAKRIPEYKRLWINIEK